MVAFWVAALALSAACSVEASAVEANPIRKVVTLMQNMQKEIEVEGEKEKELFDKFMCFCSGSDGDLAKAADDSRAKIDELASKLKSEQAEKVQVTQDLAQHKKDREGATADIAESTAIRGKEKGEFDELAADTKANLNAVSGAIPALEKGLGGSSLMQMPAFDRLHHLAETYPSVDASDRRAVIAFLDQSGDYVPQSGQIVGIMKQMKDDMEATLKEATSQEDGSVASFGELKSSKEAEIRLASEAIETKMSRSGELAVAVVQTKDALEDEQEELANTEKFLGSLKEQCATKQQEWDERCKVRNDEIAAVSEAISILNDDDALDVFKKTMPSPALLQPMGFLQRYGGRASPAHKAQAFLQEVASQHPSSQLRLMLYTVSSKLKLRSRSHEQNFGEVIKMVDDMVTLLGKQQVDDDKQREWCRVEFDKSEDEEKATQTKISSLDAAIAELQDSIAQTTEEIAALSAGIAAMDKAVAEATEQRKEEHSDYVEATRMNDVALQLVQKARNRLNKFYNPTIYKAPPKVEMSMEEKALTGAAFFPQLRRVAPPAAPETFGGYEKKRGSSTGVIGLMDQIVKELEMDSADAQHEEKTAQKDYNELMGESAQKRQEDSKSITTKEGVKADLEAKLQQAKQSHADANEDLRIVQGYINDLHISCDFIMENYDVRKEARANEVDSLNNAKAVLSGANFGL